MFLSWYRNRSPWSRQFTRPWRFPCCSVLIRWLMTMLCRSCMSHSCRSLRKSLRSRRSRWSWAPGPLRRLSTAPVRQVAQAEIVEAVEIGVPLLAKSASHRFVKAPLCWKLLRSLLSALLLTECVEPVPDWSRQDAANVVEVRATDVIFPWHRLCRNLWRVHRHKTWRVVDVPVVTQQRHDPVPHVMTDEAVRLARQAQMDEVARVIPHERVARPVGEGSSVRERAKRFEKVWGAKHMTLVEGPRTSHGERQKESPFSDVEQDTCVSTDRRLQTPCRRVGL